MGKLNYLVIHCTASPEGAALTKDDIIRMHTNPKHLGGRGWNRPGYSDIVYLDGELVKHHTIQPRRPSGSMGNIQWSAWY